jgi:HD-GYP domain-containing protein (c-di-GMP phosphodiesterase class II)
VHARIVAIADAYDAMRSDRIYRKGLPLDIIHEELAKGNGTQFDPDFLPVFKELSEAGELDEIAARRPPSKLD